MKRFIYLFIILSFLFFQQSIVAQDNKNLPEIIRNSINSTVIIDSDLGEGSGFFISSGGYIVTNLHVIENASYLNITTYNSVTKPAYVIGSNKTFDVAVLNIDINSTPLEFGDSNKIKVGETVIAIGNPVGYSFSVSKGIISAIGRTFPLNNLSIYI